MKTVSTTKITPKTPARKRLVATTPIADRVTVRLKPDLAARLATAKREQGLSVTQVVEAALERHFLMLSQQPKVTLLEALKKNKLIGCLDLGPDASANYKQLVLDSVAEKYGHR